MPKGYSKHGALVGASVKRFFPGMERVCAEGHFYLITEAMSSRRSYRCPKCASKRAVEYARKNREKKRAWNNAYHAKRSAQRAAKTAAWRAKHPEKKAAHQAVQTALRNGSLVKKPCEICGGTERVHAHHDDYNIPLQVNWLCHAHHMARHAMLAAREATQ